MGPLEPVWAEIAPRRVKPASIVVGLDVLEHARSRLLAYRRSLAVNRLDREAARNQAPGATPRVGRFRPGKTVPSSECRGARGAADRTAAGFLTAPPFVRWRHEQASDGLPGVRERAVRMVREHPDGIRFRHRGPMRMPLGVEHALGQCLLRLTDRVAPNRVSSSGSGLAAAHQAVRPRTARSSSSPDTADPGQPPRLTGSARLRKDREAYCYSSVCLRWSRPARNRSWIAFCAASSLRFSGGSLWVSPR